MALVVWLGWELGTSGHAADVSFGCVDSFVLVVLLGLISPLGGIGPGVLAWLDLGSVCLVGLFPVFLCGARDWACWMNLRV